MNKPKVGFYWCASCGGCEEAVVDLAEDILEVVDAVEIAFWPVALDFKRSDVNQMRERELAVCFINGAVRNSEQKEMVELLREKSQLVVAFGSCAHLGGIPALANLTSKNDILKEAYINVPSVSDGGKLFPEEKLEVEQGVLTLPSLWNTVKTLSQIIEVDYYLPGCPPPVKIIKNALTAILKGELPARGSVLAPDTALCDECDRRDSKPADLSIKEFKRPSLTRVDPEKCLLSQGLLCLGSVTRSGCEASCVKANMPCTGCMGPVSNVRDFGAKALSAITSVIDAREESDIERVLDGIADPVGTFYRYSLSASQIHRRNETITQKGGR